MLSHVSLWYSTPAQEVSIRNLFKNTIIRSQHYMEEKLIESYLMNKDRLQFYLSNYFKQFAR